MVGALHLVTGAITAGLIAPTLLVNIGASSPLPWLALSLAVSLAIGFILRERAYSHPLIDIQLVSHPLISSGLAFKAAANLAVAGIGYLVTLQLQLDWGWTPGQAALGMLPQVIVLIVGGWFITPLMRRVGIVQAARVSSVAVVLGLVVYSTLGTVSYGWIAVSLALIAAGMRVVGVVAGNNIMRGVPENRTTFGAALADTAGQIANGVGIAISGITIAAIFTGQLTGTVWSDAQTAAFRLSIT